tara:strand:- start:1789 stop:2691 length:903 start_codon:yes stop_codon:yes gene_type:complete
MSRSHSFSVEVAKNFKVDIALLLQHFSFWYLKNKSDNVNLFKNDYWVRMKADTLVEYFPYFTKRQLRYCIDKMIDLDLLKQDQFNDKSNDRTKWYSLTKNAKNILNISTDKIVTPTPFLSDKIVTPSDNFVTSIYKEVDIEDRYSSLYSKIEKNIGLLELIAMHNKLKIETVKSKINLFVKQSISVNEIYNNDKELFKHFQNWVRSQKLSDIDLKKELNWFLKTFNKISGRDYKKTEEIQQLFSKQFSVGFSGAEMATAIKNLYSSSIENKFHKQHNFKFATPEYLLKGDNMNKYLNFKI